MKKQLSYIVLAAAMLVATASCKKSNGSSNSNSTNKAMAAAVNTRLSGKWRYTDFDGTIIFHNPKTGQKTNALSIRSMLDTFRIKYGGNLTTDSLYFNKTSDTGGLLTGRSTLVVYCPYSLNTTPAVDGSFTEYTIISDGTNNKARIKWTYYKANSTKEDTTHVVPYDLPLTSVDNQTLTLTLDQAAFNAYALGTEQTGPQLILTLLAFTYTTEYANAGFQSFTSDDYKTYGTPTFEVTSPVIIKLTKLP